MTMCVEVQRLQDVGALVPLVGESLDLEDVIQKLVVQVVPTSFLTVNFDPSPRYQPSGAAGDVLKVWIAHIFSGAVVYDAISPEPPGLKGVHALFRATDTGLSQISEIRL